MNKNYSLLGLTFEVLYNQSAVCSTEAETIAEEHIKACLDGLRNDIHAGSLLVGILEVQATGNKAVLHHQH